MFTFELDPPRAYLARSRPGEVQGPQPHEVWRSVVRSITCTSLDWLDPLPELAAVQDPYSSLRFTSGGSQRGAAFERQQACVVVIFIQKKKRKKKLEPVSKPVTHNVKVTPFDFD